MTIEWLLVLVAACIIGGLVGTWFVVRRGDSQPLSADHEPVVDEPDEGEQNSHDSAEWPADDPESRFVLHGYRGLSDH